jgi:hypothetical protein
MTDLSHNPSVAPETQAFPTVDVLGTITGILISDIGGIYRVLEWMTDGPVWTHQIPRISREAQPAVLAMHPTLQQALDEAEEVNPGNWEQWRDTWLDRYGPELAVPRLTADQHEKIDPLSELAEKIHPSRIVAVKPGEAEE